MKSRDDEILYTARLYLFGVIPLWKVKHTKQEWKRCILLQPSNKLIELQFIEAEEEEKERQMSPLIIFNISFAFVFYPMFISNYHKREPYLLNLLLFVINALASMYTIFNYLGLLK